MAYQPPPKFYPPVELDPVSGANEITPPWHTWFLGLGADLAAEQAARAALDVRVATAEDEIDVLQAASAAGFSGSVALAKITGGGVDGSLTIVNGLITAVTAPT